MMKKGLSIAVLFLSVLSASVFAQDTHQDTAPSHGMMSMPAEMSPMQKELSGSMNKMHSAMAESMGQKNADAAFAEGMIAHHQGAIDMAKVELKYGKDPEMRKLAEAIIAAQGPEIEQMQGWLKKHSTIK